MTLTTQGLLCILGWKFPSNKAKCHEEASGHCAGASVCPGLLWIGAAPQGNLKDWVAVVLWEGEAGAHKFYRLSILIIPEGTFRVLQELCGSAGKELPAMREMWVRSLGWEDPLEKGNATHSSFLAWRIPWTVYSPWGRKEWDMTERLTLYYCDPHLWLFRSFSSGVRGVDVEQSPPALSLQEGVNSTLWCNFSTLTDNV